MPVQPGKIVVLGAVLTAVSFLVGLFQSSLPMIFMQFLFGGISLFVFFCFGIFGLVALALAAAVFSIGCLFMNPIGVCFLLAMLIFILNRKTRIPQ
ncbi:MAG: hypothetical protein IT342_16590 [Candidatus Melainabacteria bacterium]|nr:hypothetical protein [Candidatus Melainabacteria bacterium]